ncbi:MAG: family transcriptional regulator [Rhodospirillales bacterium]|nr:family transcriptional regulator [Rhodospirillales bacterium]
MRNVEHREVCPTLDRPSLGSVIFRLRARRRWTLRQLSECTGIPISTLSKVERDRATLTYERLQQVGAKLNLRMSELFGEVESASDQAARSKRDYLYLR